jgi:branched-subunit amino acid aminotransferase/4-amino-4-deoxychorismate lyase
MHTFPLPFVRYASLFRDGARLIVPPTRHVPVCCIPRTIKQRSRLHWRLAQQEVERIDPGASALLVDEHDHVTETAAANFLIVRGGAILTPPRGSVLDGVSLRVVAELCAEQGIPFHEQSLTVADCLTADEAMLSSTTFCLAGVRSLNGVLLPWPGPIFTQLLAAWSKRVGVDISRQILSNR